VVTWRTLWEFELLDPGGNPIDLWRTLVSHGIASLPPMHLDQDARTLELTVAVPGGSPRMVRVLEVAEPPGRGREEDAEPPGRGREEDAEPPGRGREEDAEPARRGRVEIAVRPPGRAVAERLVAILRYMLRLDEDVSALYTTAAGDAKLAWITGGAGRMLRSPTVFEDVVKTLCTTNCSWSATERMVTALVEHLGAPAPEAPQTGVAGRAFPTPEAMAAVDPSFYKEVARAGYRGPYLSSLAHSVASGAVDLERLAHASPEELTDDEVAAQLLALPGIGPYAAAHVMMLVGRFSRLILDSWTRPTYARLAGRRRVTDEAIVRRFRRYGEHAGLAFWLFLTRDWVLEPEAHQAAALTSK
jgi:3-methyladenine DNA glycosylase/8-oxoguanine DNA glycosylase